MAHQYKLRTYDEAMELAKQSFKANVSDHLSTIEIEEIRTQGTISGGSVQEGWESELGGNPDKNLHYEIEVYLPCNSRPYIEKSYAKILVPRDRKIEEVWIKWKPESSKQ